MLSKTQSKYIRSLAHQKYRDEHKVFVVEGVKLAEEWLLSEQSIQYVVAIKEWLAANTALVQKHPEAQVVEAEPFMLTQITQLSTANQVLLVVNTPVENSASITLNNWALALDAIQDPGNMGTIIRIADWFGIPTVICAPGCADAYSAKVVQSAMGGHLRVGIHKMPLEPYLNNCNCPVYAATLGGENLFNLPALAPGVIIIGNESKGISASVLTHATQQIKIPGGGGAESLNAGVSAGIICAFLTGRA